LRRGRITRTWNRIRDQWKFVDADLSELFDYMTRPGDPRRLFHDDVTPYPRDHFQNVGRELEEQIYGLRGPHSHTDVAPKVRIGMVMPESIVPSILEARQFYWNNEQWWTSGSRVTSR
jgi:hypothetical protein